jgi:hypothetical protein
MANRQAWINKIMEIACRMEGFDDGSFTSPAYAEPGYSDPDSGVIVFANWNKRAMASAPVKASYTMPRLLAILEHFGAETERSDEWAVCDCCRKAVRTRPGHYAWKPCYWRDEDCGVQCSECVEEDASAYVDWLTGNEDAALTFDVDLKERGYVRLKRVWAAGSHPGQTDDPREIASALRDAGCDNFIFEIESVEPCSTYFRVWLIRDDYAIYRKHKKAQSEKSA